MSESSYELSDNQVNFINSTLRSIGMYPLSMIKTLIQVKIMYLNQIIKLGYEPLPPTVGRSWTGREQLYLPNFWKYGNNGIKYLC